MKAGQTTPPAERIQTARLRLVPANVSLARAELADRNEFARLLGTNVPDNWPPESAADALPLFLEWLKAAPTAIGWFGWYALAQDGIDSSILVGGGGFLGPPRDGVVQMGYSVLSQFQRQGYATELVVALTGWAFQHPELRTIAAETELHNPASERVLVKAGFTLMGSTAEPGGMRYELHR